MRILILGASYGSLFGTKCLMAGHEVTLVCRADTAELVCREGTVVRFPLAPGGAPRAIRSADLPGTLDAVAPEQANPATYDLVVLAMQEPQYGTQAIRTLMNRVADAARPCLSLMNMPPLAYLRRIARIDADALERAYSQPRVWDRLDAKLVTLCSPDPQAVRPAGEPANVLQVGLATNFKAARFPGAAANGRLVSLARGIEAARVDGQDVPVKLRVHDSPFVPFAKWPMLLAGNYRCVTSGAPIAIREAVHGDPALSREIYGVVQDIVAAIGGAPEDRVEFDKYATAATCLTNPSSVARAIAAGAPLIERVDKLVQLAGRQHGIAHPAIDRIVALIDRRLRNSGACAA